LWNHWKRGLGVPRCRKQVMHLACQSGRRRAEVFSNSRGGRLESALAKAICGKMPGSDPIQTAVSLLAMLPQIGRPTCRSYNGTCIFASTVVGRRLRRSVAAVWRNCHATPTLLPSSAPRKHSDVLPLKTPHPTPIVGEISGACGSPRARRPLVDHWLTLAGIVVLCGCASFGRRGPVPEDVAACRELTQQGSTAMEMGQWDQAEALLTRAVKASPTDSTTRAHLAEVLWHRGATEDALLQIEAAVRLDGADASLIVRDGEMRLATGETDKALACADEAIRLNPKLSTAWALRGRVYWRTNETERALADMQRALQYAPDSPDVLMDVSALYRQRGQHDRCLTTLHHLLDTYPPGQETQLALWMEGLTLADLGRPQQAMESLAAANRKGPPNADILYQLAEAQLAAGQPEEATTTARQALAVNASHGPSRELLLQLASHPDAAQPVVR
jgi:tetratricopeptide (TPR) repeat protein